MLDKEIFKIFKIEFDFQTLRSFRMSSECLVDLLVSSTGNVPHLFKSANHHPLLLKPVFFCLLILTVSARC